MKCTKFGMAVHVYNYETHNQILGSIFLNPKWPQKTRWPQLFTVSLEIAIADV
jgi:hypothetical protein